MSDFHLKLNNDIKINGKTNALAYNIRYSKVW